MTSARSLVALAWRTLAQHTLHTTLSTLGLVIGVAALVAILSFADGLEDYARSQISETTDLQSIYVQPLTREVVDGVSLQRASVARLGEADREALLGHLGPGVEAALVQRRSVAVTADSVRTAARLTAAQAALWDAGELDFLAGGPITEPEGVLVSAALADRLGGPEAALGRALVVDSLQVTVAGVVHEGDTPAVFTRWPTLVRPSGDPATLWLHVEQAEAVAETADRVRAWMDTSVEGGQAAFTVATDQNRAEQLAQGMLVFKLVMGFITGIAVVVGGVGVMNVLLMTVTERTREIGVRKAVGAKRRDIVAQFLTEAVTISAAGSAVGLLLGLGVVFAAVPIVRSLADVPFRAGFSLGSLGVIAAVAVLVGLVFGTYPAWRAARLHPAEAIRRE